MVKKKQLFLCAILSTVINSSYGYYDVSLPIPDRAADLEEWFCDGEAKLSFRPRYEFVRHNAFAEQELHSWYNERGLTLATGLSYHSAEWRGLFGMLDFNNVSTYFDSPDPEATAVIQAYLAFEGLPDTILLGGRQIIRLDNERFVGPSDFRQMPQTFDAVSFYNDALTNVEFFYAFVGQVNTTWQGNDCAYFPQQRHTTHLANISSDIKPLGRIIAYGYFIDDHDIPLYSNQSIGMRYLNEIEVPYVTIYLHAEVARQNDLGNNPVDYRANYYHIVMGNIISIFDISGGYEVLSGNDKTLGKAFQVPLGSQHIFNGLADQFVIIPPAGLRDLYASCELNFWKINLFGQYHHFRAQANSDKYGEEWDAGISVSFLKHYALGVEYADFIGNEVHGYSDVQKVWAMFKAEFG
jgi:hypothetical protein